jgi:ubiquinone/menaquinone biosynthesis C-methylase UbiE
MAICDVSQIKSAPRIRAPWGRRLGRRELSAITESQQAKCGGHPVASSADDKQAINIAAFDREELVEEYSRNKLNVAEQSLFQRYYQRGETVLDLACGAGRTTVCLSDMGLIVKGIDTSKVLIAAARKRYPTMDFELGSYLQIQLPNASYDHVLVSFNGLDYAHPEESRLAAIRECHRVLMPGGTLIFSSHNVKRFYGSLVWMRKGSIALKIWRMITAIKECDYVYEASVGTHTFFGSPRYVSRQVEGQGFSREEMIGLPRFWGTECHSTRDVDPGRRFDPEAIWSLPLPHSYRCGHVYYVFRKL